MTNDEVRQFLREHYKQVYGIYPNDEQFREFMINEVKPAVLWMMEEEKKNEHTRNTD